MLAPESRSRVGKINHKVNMNAMDKDGNTAFFLAIDAGCSEVGSVPAMVQIAVRCSGHAMQ